MGLKENIQTLESVISGLRGEIDNLSTYNKYGSYSDKTARTFKEEVLKIIDKVVVDIYKDIVLVNETELAKEISKLEAKIFVYEEIIKKSNFKSLVEGTCDINIEKGLVE